jgi:hypothetical protein
MSLVNWAENEIRLKKEFEGKEAGGWNAYVNGCLDSALKAYKSLCEDGHSGMSFSITRQILECLMHDIPLTPIEDVPESWGESYGFGDSDKRKHFQCIRRSSLFKEIDPDGKISYHDNDNTVLDEVKLNDGHVSALGSSRTDKILKKYCPEALEIKFPYCPPRYPWRVRMSEDLNNNGNDRDFNYLSYIICPNFERIHVDKYVYFDSEGVLYEATDEDLQKYGVHRLTEDQIKMMNK